MIYSNDVSGNQYMVVTFVGYLFKVVNFRVYFKENTFISWVGAAASKILHNLILNSFQVS